jgi:hypothetical protein
MQLEQDLCTLFVHDVQYCNAFSEPGQGKAAAVAFWTPAFAGATITYCK